jgi:hypothetical protein
LPRHVPFCQTWFIEFNGIQWRGEHHILVPAVVIIAVVGLELPWPPAAPPTAAAPAAAPAAAATFPAAALLAPTLSTSSTSASATVTAATALADPHSPRHRALLVLVILLRL